MGLFGAIKAFFALRKNLAKELEEIREREARYPVMTTDELAALDDEELFEAVNVRTENKVDSFEELTEGFHSLNASQKVFYALNWLEMEVNNGGLCQFFVNSSRVAAPFVSEYMGVVGADAHKKLFDEFIKKSNINVTELSFFDIEKIEEFEEKAESYPFDDYDEAYYEMEPLQTYLQKYIREHVADF
jgi:hypothetical protein